MKLEFYRQNFEKYSNIKFNENPFGGSRVPSGWTDGQAVMTKLIVAKSKCANSLKKAMIFRRRKVQHKTVPVLSVRVVIHQNQVIGFNLSM
jgi:hypothetical protein